MKSELARRLSALRLRSGLSQKEVADRVRISAQSCSHYETGWRTPDIYILYRFAQTYEVTPEYLLGYTDDQPNSQLPDNLHSLSFPKLSKLNEFLDYVFFSSDPVVSSASSLSAVTFRDMPLGKLLRLFRKQAGLSQADIAHALEITVQAYSHYETERRTPSPETFYRIAQFYHISMNHLFTGEPDIIASLNEKINRLTPDDLPQVKNYIQYLKSQP